MNGPLSPDDPTYPGQAYYTKSFLRIYDPLVLGFFDRAVWRCPTRLLVDQYSRMLGTEHLDIGPGTGFFLQNADPTTAITLIDPNPAVLVHCATRLSHLNPTLVAADVTRPLPIESSFDSVALNYVIHCLPVEGGHKRAAISNSAAVLKANGVLFGATVLGEPGLHTWMSMRALLANNRRGIFDNLTDTTETLSSMLDGSFADHSIDVVGSVALFSARRPRRP